MYIQFIYYIIYADIPISLQHLGATGPQLVTFRNHSTTSNHARLQDFMGFHGMFIAILIQLVSEKNHRHSIQWSKGPWPFLSPFAMFGHGHHPPSPVLHPAVKSMQQR